ncbi:MAG: cyanophycin synthetase [Bacillota bacterium]
MSTTYLQIRDMRALVGPNVHAYQPVIEMLVDLGAHDGRQTTEIPGFTTTLLENIPSLSEHHCTRGRRGGFVERLQEGTYLGHVIEHVALELQALAGIPVVYGKTRRVGSSGVFNVIMEYQCREAALYAARAAVLLVDGILAGQCVDVKAHVSQVQQLAAQHDLGPSTAALVAAARRRHIPVMRLSQGSLLQLGWGVNQKRVQATLTAHTSCIAADIASDKQLTKDLLEANGIPVPPGGVAVTEQECLELAARLKVPLAIKPCDGCQGNGVTLGIQKDRDVKRAFREALAWSDRVIVEKYIEGRHYRLLVVGGQLVAASERTPAHVVGNGVNTVAELVHLANQDPRRGNGHDRPLTRLALDGAALRLLRLQKLGLHDVPAHDQRVFLRQTANLSTGGIAYDVTDLVAPENARLAVRAAQTVGLDVAGVDLIAKDIAHPLTLTGGAVIEVNAAPGIRMHHFPSLGKPRDAAGAIIDHLFPSGVTGRIPLVAITGTNGKTTVTRMIAHMGQKAGMVTGYTCSDGVFVDSQQLLGGDTTGPRSAQVVLGHPAVELAVLETARGGIIRSGLGFDRCDVAVVTNIGDDHLGQDGVETLEDLCDVKALLVEIVNKKGTVVLNADDPMVSSLASRSRGHITYFSLAPDNLAIRKHLMRGGCAVYLKRGSIYVAVGSRERKLITVRSIPASFDGRYRPNVANAMAAVAAGVALNIPDGVIKEVLREFSAGAGHNPGRLNLMDVGHCRVLVDYAHNVPAVQSLTRFLGQVRGSSRCIGVVASPGDRTDDAIERLGRVIAAGFDLVIVKEDTDLRGRRPGETASLLKDGILSAAPSLKVEIILEEEAAVVRALQEASPGDLVVILYEKYDHTMDILDKIKDGPRPRVERAALAGKASHA